MGLMKKRCTKCEKEKAIEEFSLSTGYRDGHSNWCKTCHTNFSVDYWRRNREKRRAYDRLWNQKNLERRRAIRRKWQNEHNQHLSVEEKLHRSIRTKLTRQLRGMKARKSSMKILGYSVEELKQRLQLQFRDGMSWENYGKWHIDHIKPKAAFSIKSLDDPNLKECWSLNNLQPLWAKENCTKGARYASTNN
jgi:hypothetical protein